MPNVLQIWMWRRRRYPIHIRIRTAHATEHRTIQKHYMRFLFQIHRIIYLDVWRPTLESRIARESQTRNRRAEQRKSERTAESKQSDKQTTQWWICSWCFSAWKLNKMLVAEGTISALLIRCLVRVVCAVCPSCVICNLYLLVGGAIANIANMKQTRTHSRARSHSTPLSFTLRPRTSWIA